MLYLFDCSDDDMSIDQMDKDLIQALNKQLAGESTNSRKFAKASTSYCPAVHRATQSTTTKSSTQPFTHSNEPIQCATPTGQPDNMYEVSDLIQYSKVSQQAPNLPHEFSTTQIDPFSDFMDIDTPVRDNTDSLMDFSVFIEDSTSNKAASAPNSPKTSTKCSYHQFFPYTTTNVMSFPSTIPTATNELFNINSFIEPTSNTPKVEELTISFDVDEFIDFCNGKLIDGLDNFSDPSFPMNGNHYFSDGQPFTTDDIQEDMLVDPETTAPDNIKINEVCDYSNLSETMFSPDFDTQPEGTDRDDFPTLQFTSTLKFICPQIEKYEEDMYQDSSSCELQMLPQEVYEEINTSDFMTGGVTLRNVTSLEDSSKPSTQHNTQQYDTQHPTSQSVHPQQNPTQLVTAPQTVKHEFKQPLIFIPKALSRPRIVLPITVTSGQLTKATGASENVPFHQSKGSKCKASSEQTNSMLVGPTNSPNYTYSTSRVSKNKFSHFKRPSNVPKVTTEHIIKMINQMAQTQSQANSRSQISAKYQANDGKALPNGTETKANVGSNEINSTRLSHSLVRNGYFGRTQAQAQLKRITQDPQKPTCKNRRWNPKPKLDLHYPQDQIEYWVELAPQLTNNAKAPELHPCQHMDKCVELYQGQKKNLLQNIVRTRYIRARDAFVKLQHPGVSYEYNEYFDISRPYQQQFTRVEVENGTPKNETRCALCAYCEQPSFFELKNLCYAQHMSHLHGIYTDDYLTPNPIYVGRYSVAKNSNPDRKTIARVRDHDCVVCPVCYNLSEVRCWTSTLRQKPLLNYLRHFKEFHRIGRQKASFFGELSIE